ncbi:DUF2938 domain-containing protein [Pararhodobacter zhoushanensis]|uniref:DUF2938 domain-containing protein n=1 Tax=Pararhodobacter zhoushanensis TaxID=2479545 RepID=A0ABT3H2H6_9RHOB|nr:DUF2938 domain-containing protein [Pararhodobacter zhoushanensis]MCW1933885.1 DUF2938 domain-containing protein [Pararhodobacter zhoushanensis]
MLELLTKGALIGIGATVAMDLWAILQNRLLGRGMMTWGVVGRWFWHLRDGTVFHDDIATAAPAPQEVALGWLSHYATGLVYGVVFVLIVGQGWLAQPRFVPAWIMGLLTVSAAWFLLQPGMGLGWGAAKTPNPWTVRALNLVDHTVFALGLWVTALLLA